MLEHACADEKGVNPQVAHPVWAAKLDIYAATACARHVCLPTYLLFNGYIFRRSGAWVSWEARAYTNRHTLPMRTDICLSDLNKRESKKEQKTQKIKNEKKT
jgi:hypothetical protein